MQHQRLTIIALGATAALSGLLAGRAMWRPYARGNH